MIKDIVSSANLQNCENIIEKSVNFQGDGFLEIDNNAFSNNSEQVLTEIYIWFTTLSSNGLIFWYGQSNDNEYDGEDFMALAIADGFLEFSFRLDGEETVIKHGHVELETRHAAVIKMNGNEATLEFDGDTEQGNTKATERNHMSLSGNIFLGEKFENHLNFSVIFSSMFQAEHETLRN
jgi:hypothetical protein